MLDSWEKLHSAKTTFTKIDSKSLPEAFIKIHEGTESLTECRRLYDEMASSSKKMLHNDNSWNFFMASKPKCELFLNDSAIPSIDNKNYQPDRANAGLSSFKE
jgi:hypothetical protein